MIKEDKEEEKREPLGHMGWWRIGQRRVGHKTDEEEPLPKPKEQKTKAAAG